MKRFELLISLEQILQHKRGESHSVCIKVCQSLSCVRIFVTSWTAARQAPLSMEVRILECVAIPFSRGICPTQGSKPSLMRYRWILYCLSHQGSPNHILLTFKAHSFILISTNKQEFCIFRMARRVHFLFHVRHDRHFPSILSARLSQELSTLVPTSDARLGCVFVTWKATVKASHVRLRDASVYF